MMTPDNYEVHAGKVGGGDRFGWKAYLLHLPTDTVVDSALGPDEITVRRLMERRRDERTRPTARPVANHGSTAVHLAHVDEDDTVPYRPLNPGEHDDGDAVQRAYSPKANPANPERTTLCKIPLTQRTLLTSREVNCTTCLRRQQELVKEGAQ